ncbi:DsbA family protein [Roseibaca sp. Y0-43]|uniref:DsbA family protein n=1 Tax=Roseibaca sp. Y0-43 TaxID=2816854 RepID=UPI001D0C20E6|nr:DsbA family protein [Roseibaca sp. Y0-43]MCC1480079.1 DsbA family protein [Roseibaca sp. Y0-43]
MNKFVLPAIAVAAALGAGGWWYSTQSAPAVTESASTAASPVQAHELDFPLGNADAPVTVVEYSSFTCPHCATFNQGPYEQLKADFIDTGRIQYIKREVYFDRYGLWAGMVARCGGGERYHGIVEMLYEQQRDWAGANDPAQVAANLRRLGRQAGMNDEELNACLEDADTALALTEFYQANAEADNIRATPTFVINGQQYQNMPYDEFARVLNEKLGG